MSLEPSAIHIVAAVVRRADGRLLLVEQRGPEDLGVERVDWPSSGAVGD